jgi:hypothetical protein
MKLALFLLAAAAASAQEPEDWCRQGTFVHETTFQMAELTAATHLLADDGSAKADEIANGSEVIVGHHHDGKACVWYQPPEEVEKIGWIAESGIKLKNSKPQKEPWAGDWNDRGHNWLYIASLPDSDRLRINGHARWYGNNDVIHFGRVNGDTVPGVAHLTATEGLCTVYAQLVGRYLIAFDNTRCGGVNVRFDGVYQKRSPLVGYIPRDRDGVTVGANIDLGQFTWTRLSQFPISPELREKLKPAIALKGNDAGEFVQKHPIHLTEDEARSLTNASRNAVFSRVFKQFDQLPPNVQTAIADLAVTFGDNFGAQDKQLWGSDPKLWALLQQHNWAEAAAELRAKATQLRRNFPHQLGDRLDGDADMLTKP